MAKSDAAFDSALVYRAFRAGEEDAAARLLSHGPRVPPLEISKFEQDYHPLAAVLGGLGSILLAATIVVFVKVEMLSSWSILAGIVVAGVAVAALLFAEARFTSYSPKHVHIDAETGRVELDGAEVASLPDFFAPRVVDDQVITFGTAVTEGTRLMTVVYAERTNADPFQLFTYPVTYQLQARMPEIADHLNALITEYNYRKEVRRWLDERTTDPAPYRRPESSP